MHWTVFIFGEDTQIVIACNTAHLLLPELEAHTGHAFVSLIQAVVDEVKVLGLDSVGLLASPTTIKTKLYQTRLEEMGVCVILPAKEQLEDIEMSIRAVIAGHDPKTLVGKLQNILRHMKSQGAQSVILGCTELSVVFSDAQDETLIDPMDIVTTKLLGKEND